MFQVRIRGTQTRKLVQMCCNMLDKGGRDVLNLFWEVALELRVATDGLLKTSLIQSLEWISDTWSTYLGCGEFSAGSRSFSHTTLCHKGLCRIIVVVFPTAQYFS